MSRSTGVDEDELLAALRLIRQLADDERRWLPGGALFEFDECAPTLAEWMELHAVTESLYWRVWEFKRLVHELERHALVKRSGLRPRADRHAVAYGDVPRWRTAPVGPDNYMQLGVPISDEELTRQNEAHFERTERAREFDEQL